MKTFNLSLLALLMIFTAVSCDSVLESRVSELERRVAMLENGGATPTAASINPAPVNNAATAPEVKPDGPLPEFSFLQKPLISEPYLKGKWLNTLLPLLI